MNGKRIQNEDVYCINCPYVGDMDVEIPCSENLKLKECPICKKKTLRQGKSGFDSGNDAKLHRN